MADDKNVFFTDSDKKTTERITALLLGMVLLAALIAALLAYLENLHLGTLRDLWDYFLEHIWPIWKLIATLLCLLALAGIIYNVRKLRAINLEEKPIYDPTPTATLGEEQTVEVKNEKWEQVLKYANSNNASEWRLAIIEADVILEELLRSMGYLGESVGEMLKSVDKSDFLTIEDAWEAHKVRNAVAHSGGDFQLNERETKRVVALFEKVFREFEVI